MKITLAPLVVDARGRFGGIVFSNWKGIAVAREFVPPSQPRTANQLAIRDLFRNSNALWRRASTIALANGGMIESYRRAAYGQAVVDRNVMIGLFADELRGKSNLEDFAATYPNPRAPAPTSVSATGGSGTIAVNLTTIAAPAGLALVGGGAYIVKDFDPTARPTGDVDTLAGNEETHSSAGAQTINFTSLPSGDYRCFVFAQYTNASFAPSDARHREISATVSAAATVS